MNVAILLFDGVTALDAVGPYEVLRFLPDATVEFVAATAGPKRAAGHLSLVAGSQLSEVAHPDVVVVPGGPGEVEAREDLDVLAWLQTAHATSRWTTSVCTGALTLAAAGILRDVEATTHWQAMKDLEVLGARPVTERVAVRGKVITSAGVSAGIDMALTLAGLEAGAQVAQAIQLILEYDPRPPYDAGSVDRAPSEVTAMLKRRST